MEREGYESPGNSDYRRSYNAMLSQPLFEKQDRESQASVTHISTGSKLTIQEHMYPAPSSPEKDQLLERRPTECMMSRSVDHLERPTSFPRPGQLICCSSVDQVNDSVYRKVLPALVIPAHYMKLPGDHSYVGQPLVVPADPISFSQRSKPPCFVYCFQPVTSCILCHDQNQSLIFMFLCC